MRNEQAKPIEILLVEDNPGDIRLTKEVFQEDRIYNTLSVVTDGIQALLYLKNEAPYENASRPDMILLDINLPKKSGLEVLKEIKSDKSLRTIPVIILSTSQAEKDILNSYDLHANAYVSKPVDLEQFIAVIKSLENFWLEIVKLPGESGN